MRHIALIAIALVAPATHAQSTFTGRVLSDSGVPLVGAEVVIAKLLKGERTNATGEFRLTGLPAGYHVVGIRMPGYAPVGDTVEVAEAGEVRREYRLTKITTTLPEVPVTVSLLDRKLVEFHERRKTLGAGRFLDSAEFANSRGTKVSDRLAKLPGLLIQRGDSRQGRGSEMFVTNSRQRSAGEPGSTSMCRSLVWLDGVNLGTEFNVNSLDPSIIAAVEWYAGQYRPRETRGAAALQREHRRNRAVLRCTRDLAQMTDLPHARAKLESLPFVELGHYPTPVDELARLRVAIGLEARLLAKRDDAITFGFGGNKVRKLTLVAAKAVADGADSLITCGGVQSNHCRATAAAAARLGLELPHRRERNQARTTDGQRAPRFTLRRQRDLRVLACRSRTNDGNHRRVAPERWRATVHHPARRFNAVRRHGDRARRQGTR